MQYQQNQTFEEVIETNKLKIFRICRIYAVNPITAEDLFQEVIYQIWKSYTSFKGKSSISTWIYKIALNVCIRFKEKLDKKNGKTVRLDGIQIETKENSSTSMNDEKFQALQSCIENLNPLDKSIVILSLEELAYKEIAEVTGLTENHIAVKMKRIRKKLLKCITTKIK
ncbi:RNA polymerase sigma factor [Tenacibaculum amylolyticum]|uniref:RNA polymerase sigma factor n=1 Tax=Tenacibaculum amylolyticum TaxID=104269 RepID=UPI0038941D24